MFGFLFVILPVVSFHPMEARAGDSDDVSIQERTLAPIRVTGKRGNGGEAEPAELPGKLREADPGREGGLTETLRSLPSVTIRDSKEDQGPAWISIRGQEPSQTRYFLASIPLTESEFERSPFHLFPTESFSEVQLFTSAPPVRYLSEGFGGAIDIKPKESDYHYRTALRAGSFQYLRGFLNAPIGKHQVALDLSRSDERFSFRDPNGTPYNPNDDGVGFRDRNGFWRVSLFPTIEWSTTSRSRTRSLAALSFSHTDLPGSTNRPTSNELAENFGLASLLDDRRLGEESSLSSAIYYRRGQEDLSGETPLSAGIPSRTRTQSAGMKSTIRVPLLSAVDLESSLGATWEGFTPTSSLGEVEHEKWSGALGVHSKISLGSSFELHPALLATLSHYQAKADPRFQSAGFSSAFNTKDLILLSPRLALHWEGRVLGERIRSVLAGGYHQRGPSLSELYGSTWGLGPSPSLREESAWKMEWEVQWERKVASGWVRSAKSGYAFHLSRSKDLISFVASSPQSFSAVNVGEALIFGNEFDLEIEFRSGLYARGWASLLNANNRTESLALMGKTLPGRGDRMRGEGGYRTDRWKLGYIAEWIGTTYLDLNNATRVDPYTQHSLFVSVAPPAWGEWTLDIRNLFDKQVADGAIGGVPVAQGLGGFRDYPVAGRRIFINWRYEI